MAAQPATVPPAIAHDFTSGKEGFDGSSPSDGSAKAPQSGSFTFWLYLHILQLDAGTELHMELSDSEAPRREGAAEADRCTGFCRRRRAGREMAQPCEKSHIYAKSFAAATP
jgi:hypothetical protein